MVRIASEDGGTRLKVGRFEATDEQPASAKPNATATAARVMSKSVSKSVFKSVFKSVSKSGLLGQASCNSEKATCPPPRAPETSPAQRSCLSRNYCIEPPKLL